MFEHEMMTVDIEHSCGHIVARTKLKTSDEELARFREWSKKNSLCIDCTKRKYSSNA